MKTHSTKSNVNGVITNSPAKPARQLGGYGPPDAILAMQRAAGNRATSGLLRCALESHATPIGSQKHNVREAHTSTGHAASPSDLPPIVQEAIRSPGQPLDAQTRAFMQFRFGNEFAHVRVHTGDKATNGPMSTRPGRSRSLCKCRVQSHRKCVLPPRRSCLPIRWRQSCRQSK